MSTRRDTSSRLERALEVFLQQPVGNDADAARLLDENPDLRDLLQPMLTEHQPPVEVDQQRVLGDFRLVREHGVGGMGIVYEAWQRSLDRRVAVKVLVPALVQSPAAVARFRREAAAAGRLRHANIVEVYGFGSDAGQHFFAMQFVDGEPLSTCMTRFREPARAVAMVALLVDALAHAHGHGLVHRDVKPANVLLCGDQPMLTDFGIASDEALPSITLEGGFLGTLDYASPEQVRGERIDARTDVWSVGVLLHELLTGKHPFSAATQQATIHNILSAEPASLRHLPGVSTDLAAVVTRALEKDRDRRYSTATALLADLQALQTGAAVSARLPTVSERALRWARREPWRAAATVLLVIGVPTLAATVGYLWANAPRIEAATAAEVAAAREETLATAWNLASENRLDASLARLDTIRAPGDQELTLSHAWIQWLLGKVDEARDELQPLQGETADLLRSHITSADVSVETFDGKELDAFDCFVRAQILLEQGGLGGVVDSPTIKRALEAANLAVALAPSPRLSYLITWERAADLIDDRAALASAELALSVHFPHSPVALQRRAQALCKLDAERALTLLDSADAESRNEPYYWLLRGVAFETLRRYDEAATADHKAVELDPKYERGWLNLGAVLRKQKQYAESVAAIRKAIELRPGASEWNSLALSLRSLKQNDEARHAFEKAIELQPHYASAAYNLGNLLMATGDEQAAIHAFERAVASDPTDEKAMANLGNVLTRAGRKQEALAMNLRAALAAPNDLIPNYNVASNALDLGLNELALDAAKRARDVDPKGTNGLTIHVKAMLAQPKVDAAMALREARTIDERLHGVDFDARLLLARALVASGARGEAVDLLERLQRETKPAAAEQKKLTELLTDLRASKASEADAGK